MGHRIIYDTDIDFECLMYIGAARRSIILYLIFVITAKLSASWIIDCPNIIILWDKGKFFGDTQYLYHKLSDVP